MDSVAAAASRSERPVQVVAVTKSASEPQVRALLEIGHRDLGENRVQQLCERVDRLGADTEGHHPAGNTQLACPRWHLVGHLQTNKIKYVVPRVQLIHSVDRLRLADHLQQYGTKHDRHIEILIQVNASGEPTKFGVPLCDARTLIELVQPMDRLKLRGLMTMAPFSDSPRDAIPTFAQTAELFFTLREQRIVADNFDLLSMGMTNDYQVAIEQGANLVRIGRAIFAQDA